MLDLGDGPSSQGTPGHASAGGAAGNLLSSASTIPLDAVKRQARPLLALPPAVPPRPHASPPPPASASGRARLRPVLPALRLRRRAFGCRARAAAGAESSAAAAVLRLASLPAKPSLLLEWS